MLSFDRSLAYVFLGGSILAAVEICVRTDLSGALWLAAISFLVAIPVLTLAIVMGMIDDEAIGQSLLGTLSYNVIKVVGLLLSMLGLGFLFMYQSGYLGTAYFIVVVLAIVAHRVWWEILAADSKEEFPAPNSTAHAEAREARHPASNDGAHTGGHER